SVRVATCGPSGVTAEDSETRRPAGAHAELPESANPTFHAPSALRLFISSELLTVLGTSLDLAATVTSAKLAKNANRSNRVAASGPEFDTPMPSGCPSRGRTPASARPRRAHVPTSDARPRPR